VCFIIVIIMQRRTVAWLMILKVKAMHSVIKSPIIIGSETVIRAERYVQKLCTKKNKNQYGRRPGGCLARFNQSFLKF
jgi:hypothetical protein